MVGNCHRLESDLFGIFEERVRSPYSVEPLDGEELVLPGHVGGQSQPVVPPLLAEENVRHISL